ncbi:MAG: TerD family protein [Fusobacteriaceae bacterium]
MAINLQKGQKIDLTKTNPGLNKVVLGLGWDTNKYDNGQNFDLDTSIFMVSKENTVVESDFIFYNNPKHSTGSVIHSGDNLTGDGVGDDEKINIILSLVPANIEKIAIAVTIHDSEVRKQNFGQVSNSYVRLLNEETNTELLRYDLGEDYSIETTIIFAELYRNGSEWKFSALGSGFQGGLSALCKNYGLNA